jgi:transposase-like protein
MRRPFVVLGDTAIPGDQQRWLEVAVARREYTAQEKAEALRLYVEVGPCEAARRIGINKGTITRWAKEAGVVTVANEKRRAGAEAAEAVAACKRAKLKVLLLNKAVDLLERMDEPHSDFKGKNVEQVTYPKAPASACASYATAVGILIDKFRLENGEVTGREEVVTVDAVDREIQRLESELNRRATADERDRAEA